MSETKTKQGHKTTEKKNSVLRLEWAQKDNRKYIRISMSQRDSKPQHISHHTLLYVLRDACDWPAIPHVVFNIKYTYSGLKQVGLVFLVFLSVINFDRSIGVMRMMIGDKILEE